MSARKPRPIVQSDAPEDVRAIREALPRTVYAPEHDEETLDRIAPVLAELLAKYGGEVKPR